jgi:capsular exopolysaccharide synthesis family protein
MDKLRLIQSPAQLGSVPVGKPHLNYPETGGHLYSSVEDPGAGSALEFYQLLRRHIGALVLITSIGLLAGVLLTLPQTPTYQARSVLEIQDINENFLNIKQVSPVSDGSGYAALSDIQTQIKLLQSESLIKRVLAKLNPTPQVSPGSGDASGGIPPVIQTSLLAAWRRALNLPEASAELDPTQVSRNLKVRTAGQTRLIEILYESPDPRFAANFVNTLAQEFIESSVEARWKLGQHTSEWLSRQLDDMRIKLEKSDDGLQAYARRTGLIFTSEKNDISEDKLRQLQEALLRAQTDRINKQSRWELTQTKPAESLPDVLNDSSLRALQDKITELHRQRAEEITTYTEKNNRVQRIDAQIGPLQAALKSERESIVDRIRSDYESAVRREKLLAADYAKQSFIVSDQAEKSINYNILKREVDSNRQIYEAMLQRVKESSIASAIRSSNVRIVDPADPPKLPFKPNLPLNGAVGLLSGAFIAVGFAIVRDRTDRSLRNPGEVSMYLDVPELAVIPSQRIEGRRRIGYLGPARTELEKKAAKEMREVPVELVTWQRGSILGDSFRALLASILYGQRHGSQLRVIALTSANPGEGKTVVASNLALALAEIGQRVLLVDGDLRKPRLHEIFNQPNAWGLSDLLQGTTPPNEAEGGLVATGYKNLYLLPAGTAPTSISSLLHSVRAAECVKRLREQFDMVIIDTPPMLPVPDARILGRLADGMILVVRSAQTTKEHVATIGNRLEQDATHVLGTVLNDWHPRKADRSGYGYGYGYRTRMNHEHLGREVSGADGIIS